MRFKGRKFQERLGVLAATCAAPRRLSLCTSAIRRRLFRLPDISFGERKMMKKRTVIFAAIILLCALCAGIVLCSRNGYKNESAEASAPDASAVSQMRLVNSALTEDVPDDHYGTSYEVFVYSFADSDGDGIGDLNGLRENLGYINDGDPLSDLDLGANAPERSGSCRSSPLRHTISMMP